MIEMFFTLFLAAGGTPSPPAPPAPPEPAWLGIFVGDAIDGGVQLVEVVPGSPAERAGLRPGDLLVRLGGAPVPDREAVERYIRGARAGDRAAAEILRDGRLETRWLDLAGRRGPAWKRIVVSGTGSVAAPPVSSTLGATLAALPEELRVHYGAPADRGALVTRVSPSGLAAVAGLEVGDVLVALDGRPVLAPDDGLEADGSGIRELEVVRGGQRRILVPRERSSDGARTSVAPEERVRERELGLLREELDRLRARIRELERALELERGERRR